MKSIFRISKNNNFVVMDKTGLNDKNLSWKAKGILAFMLSKPDDWTFYISELIKHSTDGERAFRSGFKELEKYGYTKRRPVREGQRIAYWETIVYENPLLCGSAHVENVDVQKLNVQNVPPTKNELTKNDSNYISTTNKAIKFYEINYGIASPYEKESIFKWTDSLGSDLVIEAMKRSIKRNKKSWGYTERILKSWHKNNITTIEQAESEEVDFRKQHRISNQKSHKQTKLNHDGYNYGF
ncbi:DnaD domain protein [Virgibacillus necropolis]|uniref:DnaD domain-containing protein n=1 Tax=Virgibacillus necropolis TaxID=163877 RepID=UPI00384A6716